MGKNLVLCALAALTCMAVGAAAAVATKPAPPSQLCISGKSGTKCTNTVAAATGGQIKWHPGHYMASNGVHKMGTPANTFQWEIAAAVKAPNVLGWRGIYDWAALEPQKDQYDFSTLDAELATLKTQPASPKRIGILLVASSYGSGNPSSAVLPQYLLADAAYGPGTNGFNHGYWSNGSLYTAALWRPAVMDRFIALIQALGAHYNNEPNFEVLMLPETSSHVLIASPDFSASALLTQMQRLVAASVEAFPNTNISIENNYMTSFADTAALVKFTLQSRAAQGGPDIIGSSALEKFGVGKVYSWGQQCVLGIAPDVGCTTDLRGEIPIIHDIQEPEMDGVQFKGMGAPFAPADLYTTVDTNLHASHVFWTWLGGSGPGNWNSVLALISANPVTHTACPRSYTGGCNTN